jgi:NAD(P)-dependent dehydrogenase (short-subunit alcohol dehydrogenase family)
VTGASQGIGAAVANLFLERGYNVVANSRRITQKNELQRSDNVAWSTAISRMPATAAKLVDTAVHASARSMRS